MTKESKVANNGRRENAHHVTEFAQALQISSNKHSVALRASYLDAHADSRALKYALFIIDAVIVHKSSFTRFVLYLLHHLVSILTQASSNAAEY